MENNSFSVIANEELCSYFANSAKAGSLSHAYILLGASGTGKHTLAKFIASAVNCEKRSDGESTVPCGLCPSCKKIMEGISPDVTLIRREKDKAMLGVEPIRFIKSDISIYPNDGDFKVYIIEGAHTMTVQAQNALLLSLEEPPSYVIFILLCENTETILETIKSRAPVLRMKTPTEEQTLEYIKSSSPSARNFINNSPEDYKQIYKASGGSIGKILELISSSDKKQILEDRALTERLIEAVAQRSLSENFAEISALFSQKRDERERIIAQLSQIQMALRDLVVLKKADSPALVFFTDRERAEELSYSFSTQKLVDMLESTEKARVSLLRNANVKLTVINYLSGLI
ncbi:MAG: ATP-binding protein [Eubacteriales bacterium]